MIELKSIRFCTLLWPVFICCIPGCDTAYDLNVVVANTTGEPMMGVSYKVVDRNNQLTYQKGETKSDGKILFTSVGRRDLLVELEKSGFKKISKKMVMKPLDSPPVVLKMDKEEL